MSKKQKIFPFTTYENTMELRVEVLNDKGQGIAHLDEYEIYLDGGIEGELVLAAIGDPFANGSKRRPGTIIAILESSPDRARDNPRELTQSAIYPYGSMTYEATVERKHKAIEKALEITGNAKQLRRNLLPSNLRDATRFKSIRYFGNGQNNSVISGFYKAHSHDILPITGSSFEPSWFSLMANDLCSVFTQINVPVYNEITHEGAIRSVLFRDTVKGKLSVLVTAKPLEDSVIEAYKKSAAKYGVDSVYINLNSSEGNRVLDGESELVAGKENIKLDLCGFVFKAGPSTFLQVNYSIAEKLYEDAVNWCGTGENKTALDLCCGVGTLSLCLAQNFKKVIGVEINAESVEAAKDNAEYNKVTNVDFEIADIKEKIDELVDDENVSAVICDPARSGIGENACRALGRLKGPVKLAYIFCALPTLSKELKVLQEVGYKVDSVHGYDMFPYTSHVETLVLLSKAE